MNFQVTYRRDPSAVAFATSVGKAQPQTEYKVHLTNLSKQVFSSSIIALDVGISLLRRKNHIFIFNLKECGDNTDNGCGVKECVVSKKNIF